jgi:hypothetical protein
MVVASRTGGGEAELVSHWQGVLSTEIWWEEL